MKEVLFVLALFIFVACQVIAPGVTTEECLQKVEYVETLQTAAVETLAEVSADLPLSQLRASEKYLTASDKVLTSAASLCDTDERTAIKLLQETQHLIIMINEHKE